MSVGQIERIAPYLQAREIQTKAGAITRRWTIHSGNVPDGDVGELIATVAWYSPWRRYCVEADHGVVLDNECLRALADFIQRRTTEHKAQRAKARQEEQN